MYDISFELSKCYFNTFIIDLQNLRNGEPCSAKVDSGELSGSQQEDIK